MNKINKLGLLIIALYFFLSGLIHFARLTFSWEIILKGGFGEQAIPSYISGFCILFSILVVAFCLKSIKKAKIDKKEKSLEERTSQDNQEEK